MKRLLAALAVGAVITAWGVAHFDTVDRNRTASGVATNCFQYVGEMACFPATYTANPPFFMCNACTAVGPRAFATASHVGFTPAWVNYQGLSYTVTGEVYLSGPEGDAKLILVGSDLPSWSPVFTNAALAAHTSVGALANTSGDYLLIGNGAEGSFYPTTPGETGVSTSSGLNTKRWASGIGLRATNAIICAGTIDATNMTKVQLFFDNVTGQGAAAGSGDSGSAIFVYNSSHSRWEYLGAASCADSPAIYSTWASTGFPLYQHIATFAPYLGLDGSGTTPPPAVVTTRDRPSIAGARKRRGL